MQFWGAHLLKMAVARTTFAQFWPVHYSLEKANLATLTQAFVFLVSAGVYSRVNLLFCFSLVGSFGIV